MSSFKALRVHKTDDGLESRIDDVTLDDVTEGEVVIKTAYSCLNYKDALAVTGKGRIMRSFPLTAGVDASGVVESSEDDRFKPGDEVLVGGCNIGEQFDGGLAEKIRVNADFVVPLPNNLSLYDAMVLGTAGFTAGLAVLRMIENHQTPDMGPIAVTGPTGGVGATAIDILAGLGYEVSALTRKPEESADFLKAMGASDIVDARSIEMGTKPLEKALWGGAVDNVGGDLLAWLTRTIRPWGNIASIGLAASHKLETTVMPFILRGVNLLGIHSVEMPMELRLRVWDKLSGEWKPQHLDTIGARTVSLDEVPAICEDMVAGKVTGRTVVEFK